MFKLWYFNSLNDPISMYYLGRGFFSEYMGIWSYLIQGHSWAKYCVTLYKTSGNQPWTKPCDEATCGNALSAVLNFYPAPFKYEPSASPLFWFQRRVRRLDLAAQQRNCLEAAIEHNVCLLWRQSDMDD